MGRRIYQPGVLLAVAYDADGKEVGCSELWSATGKARLTMHTEVETFTVGDIAYISIDVIGENGVLESNADRKISIQVENGELLGFGSARPNPVERYDGTECITGKPKLWFEEQHPAWSK